MLKSDHFYQHFSIVQKHLFTLCIQFMHEIQYCTVVSNLDNCLDVLVISVPYLDNLD